MLNSRSLTAISRRAEKTAPVALNRRAEQFKLPLLLTLIHIPLGILLYNSGAFGVLHAYAAFAVGLYWAYQKREKLEKSGLAVTYIIGVEVLWRMAHLPVFWEFGKYGAAAIMIVALVRRGHLKIPTLPLLYFVFLIPSCILTLTQNELEDAKQMLSFNMSGPLLLFVSCWFCSYLKISWSQIKTLFFIIIVPLSSVAVTTLFYTVTTADIHFDTESNHATSGGFGPNQVSAMLGLGAFLCISAYLLFKNRFQDNLFLGLLTILFTAQSVMTFSRGGIYNALGAGVFVVLFQMQNLGQGIKRLLPVAGLAAIFLLLVFPYLDNFTGGKLQERFEETDPTNRSEIVQSDFRMFSENPVFGMGVGESSLAREKDFPTPIASHTEYSRIISEHGIFGVFALGAIVLMFINNLKRQTSGEGRAIVAGMLAWSNLFMLNAGMRLAAPAFIFGLSFLTVRELQTKSRKFLKKNENK